ncbi:MAG: adenosine deaminase [Rhizobiaceae bacterium]
MLKAEIHCHIEGAADPGLVVRLARKYKLDLNDIIQDGKYIWSDFTTFLNAYDGASSVFREPDDYRLLAYDYFSRLADQNAIYGEVFASADHGAMMGISYVDMVEAIAAGINDAKKEYGVEGRIIMSCVRHLGPESAENVAEQAASNPHPMVTGFGMGGDERSFTVEDFASAFAIAGDAELGLTAHAGEFAGAESVRDALDHLRVTRIGHGVRSIEDRALVERLVEEEIVLEACPGSNISLEVYPNFKAHPLRDLHDAGVRVTLNSDDPPYFFTTLANEYEIAAQHFGFDESELRTCTRTALESAFVDETTRQKMLNRLDNST